MSIRSISYGGGVQSTALLVLAAQGEIDFPLAIFANTGDDSEHPETIDYVYGVAMPYAHRHGIELVEIRKTRHGEPETLMQHLMRDNRSIGIPVRLGGSGAPANRNCRQDFKIKPIVKELKRRGATKDDPATTALGISLDELTRMRSSSGIPQQVLTYPLIDRRMDRQSCMELIKRADLPVPPKSSCFFCPFHGRQAWRRLKRDHPDLFATSANLEQLLSERHQSLTRADGTSRGELFFTSAMKPLDEAIVENGQMDMFEGATCDIGGYCFA